MGVLCLIALKDEINVVKCLAVWISCSQSTRMREGRERKERKKEKSKNERRERKGDFSTYWKEEEKL